MKRYPPIFNAFQVFSCVFLELIEITIFTFIIVFIVQNTWIYVFFRNDKDNKFHRKRSWRTYTLFKDNI